jgi:hypothetical protein
MSFFVEIGNKFTCKFCRDFCYIKIVNLYICMSFLCVKNYNNGKFKVVGIGASGNYAEKWNSKLCSY